MRRPPPDWYLLRVDFESLFADVARVIEGTGVVIMAIGLATVLIRYLYDAIRKGTSSYEQLRVNLGRVILLGLEILIVADIITTITIDQTPSSAITLGIVVLVRTFLSFSLEIELDGALPWRRAALSDKAAEDAV